jgi:hypothetical protein
VRLKTMIVFPYSGYQKGSDREALFWKVVAHCREIAGDPKPTVVLNADTGLRGGAKAFQKDSRSKTVDVCRVWSVDTCQMWLAGWGHILDHYPRIERIVQLPGDLDWVEAHGEFFLRLDSFLVLGDPFNLIIGDFETSGRFSAKNLIDYYGTYAVSACILIRSGRYRTRAASGNTESASTRLNAPNECLKCSGERFMWSARTNPTKCGIGITSWINDRRRFARTPGSLSGTC